MNEFWVYVEPFVNELKEWQTAIVGILAVVYAAKTVWQIRRQRADEKTRHQETERKKSWAARAQMPDALSEISTFCRAVVSQLDQTPLEMPPLPERAIDTLKLVIEHIAADASRRTFELLSHYQVHNARLQARISDSSEFKADSPDWENAMYDVALLQTFANSLYDYARNKADTSPTGEPDRKDLYAGLVQAVGMVKFYGDEDRFRPVVKLIEQYHPDSES